MLKIDEFESVFKSAAKERYVPEKIEIKRIALVHDLDGDAIQPYLDQLKSYLHVLVEGSSPDWLLVRRQELSDVGGLLDRVEQDAPDLICTYRNLCSNAWRWPFSLGEDVDVLTQATNIPVLVLPNPHAGREAKHALKNTNSVMVVTDHLTGDHRLVSYGLDLTEVGGTLYLTHIASKWAFDNLLETIEKIPEIDTQSARELISEQALKEPSDYIESVREILESEQNPVKVAPIVKIGPRLETYRELVETHEVDLLVLNTKDERQLAMHPMAHPLAIEIRSVPLLML